MEPSYRLDAFKLYCCGQVAHIDEITSEASNIMLQKIYAAKDYLDLKEVFKEYDADADLDEALANFFTI